MEGVYSRAMKRIETMFIRCVKCKRLNLGPNCTQTCKENNK